MTTQPEFNFAKSAKSAQRDMILSALKRGDRLTPMDALRRFGCMRLGARVWELRRAGHDIQRNMVETGSGKQVAEYRMEGI